VLDCLLKEGVLTNDPKFYFVVPDRFSEVLGITWHDLQRHMTSDRLEEFLTRAMQ
jgi:hypothetical protein